MIDRRRVHDGREGQPARAGIDSAALPSPRKASALGFPRPSGHDDAGLTGPIVADNRPADQKPTFAMHVGRGASSDLDNAIRDYADRPIPVADQVRVLHFLSEHGPSYLMDVAQAATASADPIATLLALCCSGLVGIDDADDAVGPETIVRRIGRR